MHCLHNVSEAIDLNLEMMVLIHHLCQLKIQVQNVYLFLSTTSSLKLKTGWLEEINIVIIFMIFSQGFTKE